MPNPDFPSSTCPVVYSSASSHHLCSCRPKALVPWKQQQEEGHAHPYCVASPHTCCSSEEITLFRQCSDLFYSPCLAAYISPIHLHGSWNCVIYQEIVIQSNLNDFNTLQLFLIKFQAYLVIPGITKSWILLKLPTVVLWYFSDFHQAQAVLSWKCRMNPMCYH